MKFILASGSPRRKQLLQTCGIQIDFIIPARIPEQIRSGEEPLAYCMRLAKEKSAAVFKEDRCVLAADTIVCTETEVFEKPENDEDAFRILSSLSGKWHRVITAWELKTPTEIRNGASVSKVLFRNLKPVEIRSYIRTGEGNDKAGSYGIQGLGAALISEISGSYSNIVGLPMTQVMAALEWAGIHPKEN